MRRFKSGLLNTLVAVLATGSALLVRRFILVPVFDLSAPLITFSLAVVAATSLGGLEAGLIATLLGSVANNYLDIGDTGSRALPLSFQPRLLLFVVAGTAITWLVHSRQTARRRMEERQRQLEVEVRERRHAEAAQREQRDRLAEEMHRREAAELALREREERTRLAVESAEIGTFDFNPITGERNWSQRTKAMFGLPPNSDVSNVLFLDRVHPEDRERAERAVQKAFDPSGDGAYDIDCRVIWPDGSVHWFIAKGQALFEGEKPNRRAIRFLGTVLEITERKRAEDALRDSESRLRAILGNTSAVIYLKDVEGRFLLVNRRFEELFKVSSQQIVGKTDAEVFPRDVVAKLQANDRQVRETAQPLEFEEVVPHGDGPHTYISVKFPIFDSTGQCHAVGGISTDISDRKRAADELKAEQELLRHTIEVQDHERQLVAYEIHDGLVQYATGALMRLEGLQNQVKSSPLSNQIENIVDILRKTVGEGRRLVNGIRTPVLDDWGVGAAVEQLIEAQDRSDVQIEFVMDKALGRMSPRIEETLYRITHEALTNIQKHSQSKKARIELGGRGDRVRLEIRDWGVGFAPSNGSKSVHGLKGMAKRASLAGGECIVESAAGEGTRVIVDLPYVGRQ
jgi:PAS domain S-box-containing protein